MAKPKLNYLSELEAEAIYILREAVAQSERPVLLFSGGKDSICLVHLAEKAFRPARFPFALMHIDTGHNFPETIQFRDLIVKRSNERLIVRSVEDSIRSGRVVEKKSLYSSRNSFQTVTLLDALREFKFDVAIGGARRDEEKARAKERIFSFRDEFGQWDPKNQRPELWNIFNGKIHPGEQIRVFPLSNWTELDVWRYIETEKIELPKIYFAHTRKCVKTQHGMLLAHAEYLNLDPADEILDLKVRCRTIGDVTCTGLIESTASTVSEVIQEIISSRVTERGGRADDKVSESAMEDRKRQGYF